MTALCALSFLVVKILHYESKLSFTTNLGDNGLKIFFVTFSFCWCLNVTEKTKSWWLVLFYGPWKYMLVSCLLSFLCFNQDELEPLVTAAEPVCLPGICVARQHFPQWEGCCLCCVILGVMVPKQQQASTKRLWNQPWTHGFGHNLEIM